jgi:hypothetical protein
MNPVKPASGDGGSDTDACKPMYATCFGPLDYARKPM